MIQTILYLMLTIFSSIPNRIRPFLLVFIFAKLPLTLLLTGALYVYMTMSIFNYSKENIIEQKSPLLLTYHDDKEEKERKWNANKQITLAKSLSFNNRPHYASIHHNFYNIPKDQTSHLLEDDIFNTPIILTATVMPRIEDEFSSLSKEKTYDEEIMTTPMAHTTTIPVFHVNWNAIHQELKTDLRRQQEEMCSNESNYTTFYNSEESALLSLKPHQIPMDRCTTHRKEPALSDTIFPLLCSPNSSLVSFASKLSYPSISSLPTTTTTSFDYLNSSHLLSALSLESDVIRTPPTQQSITTTQLITPSSSYTCLTKMSMIEAPFYSIIHPSPKGFHHSSIDHDPFVDKENKSKFQHIIYKFSFYKKRKRFKNYFNERNDTMSEQTTGISDTFRGDNTPRNRHSIQIRQVLKTRWRKMFDKKDK
ncbi:uncharacterized protein BX663DRAFT_325134 [Cokeromyces recurvatus]|uniref:uncharacterized protein n=1 Tax=Cokeromyces recurvatus TaxID=90255 RepID=UPI002220474B|nr:uncharacterized protein BX663DRAFT_325134 [Cokeromyces recurvatus]KAI7904692.1 hypothetical protein BX663DRAFT_325134 [Cokeromyces recurvatus]